MEILQLIKNLLLPSNLGLILLWSGVALLLTKTRKLPLVLMIAGGGIVTIFSSGIIATSLLSPLEYSYPLAKIQQNTENQQIVLLASYVAEDNDMPLSSRINSHAAYRILETVHIYNQCEACKVIISGNGKSIDIYRQLLISMGVSDLDLYLDNNSRHTDESAVNLRKLIGSKSFYLVTSAGHMPRAMGVFKKLDMNPVPAPTDFSMPKNPLHAPIGLSSQHLYYSDLASNELMGLVWYKIAGRI